MKRPICPKCSHCQELFTPDHRVGHRQRYCAKALCRQASKAASQRRWQAQPENKNYFRGAENTARVQQWRRDHPGYWRRGRKKPRGDKQGASTVALQEECPDQRVQNQEVMDLESAFGLQDLSLRQPALAVGLISLLTGSELQEEIAASARRLLLRGQDILGPRPAVHPPCRHENQTFAVSPAFAPGATPV